MSPKHWYRSGRHLGNTSQCQGGGRRPLLSLMLRGRVAPRRSSFFYNSVAPPLFFSSSTPRPRPAASNSLLPSEFYNSVAPPLFFSSLAPRPPPTQWVLHPVPSLARKQLLHISGKQSPWPANFCPRLQLICSNKLFNYIRTHVNESFGPSTLFPQKNWMVH